MQSLILLGVFCWGLTWSATQFLVDKGPAYVLLVVVVALAVGLLVGWWTQRKNQADGCVWTDAHFTLELNEANPHRMVQRTDIEVKAQGPRVHILENRYRWTGRGTESLPRVRTPHQQLLIPERNEDEDGRRLYYIFLERPLDKDQRARVEIEQEFHDAAAEMQARLTKLVSYRVERLKLTVKLPVAMIPIGARAEGIERGPAPDYAVLRQVTLTFDEHGVVEWEPQDVTRGFRYEISWVWHNYPPAEDLLDLRDSDGNTRRLPAPRGRD